MTVFARASLALILAHAMVVMPQPAAANKGFPQFLQSLWPEAQQAGVSRATFDKAVRGLKPKLSLPDLEIPGQQKNTQSRQAEFTREPREYLNAPYLARLATRGRQLAKKHTKVLADIEEKFGVDRYSVLAIFGRETAFGSYKPKHDAIRVLATQAYYGRRKERFRSEFIQALRLLQLGVPRSKMKSSWAGAMGMTQFLPSEFFKHAHDMGTDGYADLFESVPDALASAARQLKNHGWVRGQTWGYEIKIPKSSSCALEGPPGMRSIKEWITLGYSRVANRKFPEKILDQPAYLMSPAGAHGPSFLVLKNFQVIRAYNTSDLYATFVGNLADRIAGGGDFVTPFKKIGPQRTKIIRAVQQNLKDGGYSIGKIDGFIGSGTRRQVGQYQVANGLTIDCWPSARLSKYMSAQVKN